MSLTAITAQTSYYYRLLIYFACERVLEISLQEFKDKREKIKMDTDKAYKIF